MISIGLMVLSLRYSFKLGQFVRFSLFWAYIAASKRFINPIEQTKGQNVKYLFFLQKKFPLLWFSEAKEGLLREIF